MHLEDAIDAVKARGSRGVTFSTEETPQLNRPAASAGHAAAAAAANATTPTAFMAPICDTDGSIQQAICNDAEMGAESLPEVDIFKDPRIWICFDEGCNANCHSDEWARNTDEKIAKMNVQQKFEWVHRRAKTYNGIGGTKVGTLGKRRLPAAWWLVNQKKVLSGFLESHEQKGSHPLLLSDGSQARMGFVKDMRAGKIYLKDYDDYIDIYRAKGSGLRVVCISHFPEGAFNPADFASKPTASSQKRDISPDHPILVAHPAVADVRETEKQKQKPMMVSSTSLGIELGRYTVKKSFAHVTTDTVSVLWHQYGDWYKVDYENDHVRKIMMRRFLEEQPQFEKHRMVFINCLAMDDPHHDPG